MKQLHFGKKLRYCVPSELESRVLGAALYTKSADGWTPKVKESGIFFDLSRVEWFDLGALVQLVLLIESALKNEIAVTIALPFRRARQSEEEWMDANKSYVKNVMYRIKRRAVAFDFLKNLRFEQALRTEHLARFRSRLRIIEDYDLSTTDLNSERKDLDYLRGFGLSEHTDEASGREPFYKYCFPLAWLSGDQSKNFKAMANFLTGIVGRFDEVRRGLEAPDADTIANVILYELVENVLQHAQTRSWGIVTAWARPIYSKAEPLHYLEVEHPYINWLNQKKTPLVEILVGDSGKGIPGVLRDDFKTAQKYGEAVPNFAPNEAANVLLWAFDRWSSSKDRGILRGTRGLYRVDRVVKKYQGLITVRSENQLAGWDHGGVSYDEQIFHPRRLSHLPGTLLRLRLPPFSEDYKHRTIPATVPTTISFETFHLGSVESKGMNASKKNELKRLFQKKQSVQPLCIIGIVNGGVEKREIIEEFLRQAVEIRHPGALIVCGLPGGEDLIDNTVDSINVEHEKERRDSESYKKQHFDIWDPVLVVGPSGKTYWVGASKPYRKVLQSVLNSGGSLSKSEIEQLLPIPKERGYVYRQLRNDTHLVILEENGNVKMRFTLSSIPDYLSELFDDYISKGGPGVLTNGVFRAPSLHLTKKWLDVGKVLEETCGSELAMLALSIRLKEHECWTNDYSPNFILADSTNYSANIEALQRFLGIQRKEIIPGETGMPVLPGIHIIDSGTPVIIHSDIIVSGESVKRCIRLVLRDGAIPVAITCLFNAREDAGEAIEMWDIKVPVISLTKISIMVKSKIEGTSITTINPITRQQEEPLDDKDDSKYTIKDEQLKTLIEKNDALYFSHIGRPIGRHFTFYIDASRLIEEKVIAEAFDSEITKWIGHDKTHRPKKDSEKIDLWHPRPEPKQSAPAHRFAQTILSTRNDIQPPIRIIRREPAYGQWFFAGTHQDYVLYPNVLIVDWGALTGTTVIQMVRLAAEAGAQNILVCIFLSQLPPEEEAFLNILHSLHVLSRVVNLGPKGQPFLPGFKTPGHRPANVKVSVRFLSRLPIGAYDPNECPVCQQLARISQEVYPTDLLKDFAYRQKYERLLPRKREEVLKSSPKDFGSRDLLSSSIIEMGDFRKKLAKSLGSTLMRQQVKETVENIANELKTNPNKPSNQVLNFIHFLSVETQWLRKPPLYFKTLRDQIAEMSLIVAQNKGVGEIDRLNSIIVLRTSLKKLFAEQFASIFKSIVDSEQLMEQLLYDAFTYVSRPYHQTPSVLEPMRDGLRTIQDKISKGELSLHCPNSSSFLETINRLVVRAETELAKAGIRFDTPYQSWSKLRSDFSKENYHPHDLVPRSILWMQPGRYSEILDKLFASDSETSLNSYPSIIPWLKSLKGYWETCCEFLDYTVLPRLSHLKPILLSEEGRVALGTDTVEQLIDFVDKLVDMRTPLAESDFSQLVDRIHKDPNYVLMKGNWDKYIRYSYWFWERILRPFIFNQSPSRLIKFLMSAPSSLGAVVNSVYKEMQSKLPLGHKVIGISELLTQNYKVFCTERLLHGVIKEFLLNIKKHIKSGEPPLTIWFEALKLEGKIIVTVRNNSTKPKEQGGTGLQRFENELRPFGARLIRESRPNDGESTYKVDVRFIEGG